jgi:hypothetical protein
MNLSDEMTMWLERQKAKLIARIEPLQEQLDFIQERLDGKHTEKLPRQYYHIPGQFTMVHGSNLVPPYYEFMEEYQKFLGQSDVNN